MSHVGHTFPSFFIFFVELIIKSNETYLTDYSCFCVYALLLQ
jgi:hypothetical protein